MASSILMGRRIRVTMSAKGQMVIPAALRAKLGLRSGAGVWVELNEDGSSLHIRPDSDFDPMSMRGMLADSLVDPLKSLEEDRRREIEDDLRAAGLSQGD